LAFDPAFVNRRRLRGLSGPAYIGKSLAMGKDEPSREERLAAKLRENLRRRKAQAKALGDAGDGADKPALPKEPPGS
jgi:hypothetical protein